MQTLGLSLKGKTDPCLEAVWAEPGQEQARGFLLRAGAVAPGKPEPRHTHGLSVLALACVW